MSNNIETKEYISPSKEFVDDFKILVSLPKEKLLLLIDNLKIGERIDLKKNVQLLDILKLLQISPSDLSSIIIIIRYIQEKIYEENINFNILYPNLLRIVEYFNLPKIENIQNELKKLFEYLPKYKVKIKKIEDKMGMGYHVTNISSTTELRALFIDENKINYYPISTIMIGLQDNKGNKKKYTFNASEESLDFLINAFKKEKDRIQKVKESAINKQIKLI